MESKLDKIRGDNKDSGDTRDDTLEGPLPVDPVAIEKAMVEEEQRPLDEEEIACMMLKLYTPRFNRIVDGLSNRSLKRLIKALIEFPLGKTYKHPDKDEAEAFMVGQGLMDAKMVLVMKTYSENKEQIIEMAAEAAKNAELTFGEPNEEKEVK